MICGTSQRDDQPFRAESAEEVFLEPDAPTALLNAFDILLQRRGLELLYLQHDQVSLALLDIVPLGADLGTLQLPEGSVRESLHRPA